jgi:uncharacterized membrane protein YciS (DUF1049 family)
MSEIACFRQLSSNWHIISTFVALWEGRTHMFAVVFAVFSAMVILALVSGVFYFAMRIRLMRADTARDRIEWLSFRSSDEVLDSYEALFPRSVLPRFCRFIFWTVIVIGAVGLCGTITLKLLGR